MSRFGFGQQVPQAQLQTFSGGSSAAQAAQAGNIIESQVLANQLNRFGNQQAFGAAENPFNPTSRFQQASARRGLGGAFVNSGTRFLRDEVLPERAAQAQLAAFDLEQENLNRARLANQLLESVVSGDFFSNISGAFGIGNIGGDFGLGNLNGNTPGPALGQTGGPEVSPQDGGASGPASFFDVFGQGQLAALNQRFDEAGAAAEANLFDRGLGTSTLVNSAQRGVDRERELAVGQLQDSLLGRQLDFTQGQQQLAVSLLGNVLGGVGGIVPG